MKKDIEIVKEKHTFGIIESYYQDGKLIKKIDYTSSRPLQYNYDSNGDVQSIISIGSKSHKKLWLGIIGSLVILSALYATYKTVHHSSKQLNTTSQYVR